ncbi:MAG: hypothetical protein NTW86_24500, partial [Candidatus Sumerlaeota bacterium]|nr:hypothetical protein [Candidatus Sumerlaeota bacterium]
MGRRRPIGAEKEGAAEAAELFDLEGIPEPGQVGDDRRALPRAGADQASIPDDAGAGAPPDHLLKGPATEKRYRSLSGGPPKEALGPADSRPADTVFAIPEEDAEEVHRVEAPKSFAAFDRALSLVFAFGAFILVVCSYHGIGFSWDEGYYYVAARSTQAWLHLIHTDGLSAFSRENIDKYLGPGPDIPDQPSGNVPELPMVPKILYAVGLSI